MDKIRISGLEHSNRLCESHKFQQKGPGGKIGAKWSS